MQSFVCKSISHAPLQEEGFIDKGLVENIFKKNFCERCRGEIPKVHEKNDYSPGMMTERLDTLE